MRIIAALAIIISLSSCTIPDDGYLSVAVAQEPQTLDVMMSTSASGRSIALGNIYERMLELDEDGTIRPVLAESWELSDDGCSLRLEIRDGILFHDGSTLDSQDAADSLNRWLSLYGSAGRMTGGAGFTAEGDAVEIHCSSPIALLPLMMASSPQAAIIIPSESLLETTDSGLLVDAPGTGPYCLERWSYGSSIELEAFDGYHGKRPRIERIRYSFVPDPVTRRLGLESGQYDFIDTIQSDDISGLSEMDGITLHQGRETGSIVIVFNKRQGISQSLDFRRAVSLVIDRDELMAACYGDYGYSLHSDYMDEDPMWSVDSSLDPYGSMDEESGRALLAEGGHVDILAPNLTNLDRIAIALASQLEEAGLDVSITILDWASFIARRSDREAWDIYISATSRVALPLEKAYLFAPSPGGFDDAGCSELLDELAASPDIETAAAIWQEAQIELWKYVPVIVPGHYSTVHASSSDLQGIDFSDGFHFRTAFFK